MHIGIESADVFQWAAEMDSRDSYCMHQSPLAFILHTQE